MSQDPVNSNLNILMITLWSAKYPVINKSYWYKEYFSSKDILLDVRSNCHKNFITLQNVVYFLTSHGYEETMETGRELGFTENYIGVLRKASNSPWFKDAPINNFNFKDLWFITSKRNYGEETTMNIISVGRIKSFPFVITRTQTCDLISDWR